MRERLPSWLSSLLRRAALAAGIGGFLAFIGAYSSEAMPLGVRFAFWFGTIGFGLIVGEAIADRMFTRLTPRWPVWAVAPLVAAAISIPVTVLVMGVNWGLGGDRPGLGDLPRMYLAVLVISLAMTGLGVLLHRLSEGPARADSPGRALLDKLPPRLRAADIWALESEDHYLRVRTSAGDALILMRLSDAMAAVEALPGQQTHRSWWVAEAGVENARRESGGRATLVLKDGAEAPVSRANAPKLREAGWLQ